MKLLKGGYTVAITGVIKGDTSSLDYGSCGIIGAYMNSKTMVLDSCVILV